MPLSKSAPMTAMAIAAMHAEIKALMTTSPYFAQCGVRFRTLQPLSKPADVNRFHQLRKQAIT
jgi:hypothetical protein